jgi:hypothetical protein
VVLAGLAVWKPSAASRMLSLLETAILECA